MPCQQTRCRFLYLLSFFISVMFCFFSNLQLFLCLAGKNGCLSKNTKALPPSVWFPIPVPPSLCCSGPGVLLPRKMCPFRISLSSFSISGYSWITFFSPDIHGKVIQLEPGRSGGFFPRLRIRPAAGSRTHFQLEFSLPYGKEPSIL